MDDAPPDWMTTGEVARLAAVSTETVRLWERVGKLTAERVGGMRMFRRAEVARFLARRALRRQG